MCPLYALEDYINLKCEEKSLYSYLFELVNRHGIRHNAYGINGLHVVIDDLKSLTRIFNCCEKHLKSILRLTINVGLLVVKDNDYFVKRPVDYHTEALIDNSIHLSKYYAPFE